MENQETTVQFSVHTSNLLSQVFDNPGTAMLHIPINVLARLLAAVATRSSELNDPQLNALMCRLTLYAIADPETEDYDPDAVRRVYELEQQSGQQPYCAYCGEDIYPDTVDTVPLNCDNEDCACAECKRVFRGLYSEHMSEVATGLINSGQI